MTKCGGAHGINPLRRQKTLTHKNEMQPHLAQFKPMRKLMKCFDVNYGKVTRGLPINDLSGIKFGGTLLPFHSGLINHGGDACFGNMLVNVDVTKVFRDPGYELMMVAPGADNDSALIRVPFQVGSNGTSRVSSVSVSEWNAQGDAEEVLSGTTCEVYGGEMHFCHVDIRVSALRISKGSWIELKQATKRVETRRFRKALETIIQSSTIYSFDGNTVSIETRTW